METALDLVCVLGYTGKFTQTLVHHPADKSTIIYAIGSTIVISDKNDAHKQTFLRGGHDADISLIEISSSGRFLASTQVGSTKEKGNAAKICVWEFKTGKLLHQIRAHSHTTNGLSFSHDDLFLASIGEKKLLLWDLSERAERAGAHNLRGVGRLVKFAQKGIDFSRTSPKYTLVYADGKVGKLDWVYDIRQMNFKMIHNDFRMPGRMFGLKRTFTTCEIDPLGETCYVGTRLGEVMVYSIKFSQFITSFLVSANGVFSLRFGDKNNVLLVGGGDESLRILLKNGENWRIAHEIKLDGIVTSLASSEVKEGNPSLILAGTDGGRIYEVDSNASKILRVVCESHVSEVNSCSFDATCEKCLTSSKDGRVVEWNLSSYSVSRSFKTAGYPTCAMYVDKNVVLAGWSDGSIKMVDLEKKEVVWKVINAHRGAVSSVDFNDIVVSSAGIDGAIRVWTRKSKELVSQFSEHSKAVSKILMDVSSKNILHSCSIDKTIFTYDLKANRRTTYHELSPDSLLGLAQKPTGEMECITSSSLGKIREWDVDYKEPTNGYNDEKIAINCIDVSPKSGKYLATGNDSGVLKICLLEKKKIIAVKTGHSSEIVDLKWSPDERQIISVSRDCSICVWNFYQ